MLFPALQQAPTSDNVFWTATYYNPATCFGQAELSSDVMCDI